LYADVGGSLVVVTVNVEKIKIRISCLSEVFERKKE
jgi:hypothetical protein